MLGFDILLMQLSHLTMITIDPEKPRLKASLIILHTIINIYNLKWPTNKSCLDGKDT